MSDEREFLECEIADAMESDEDIRPEVAAIIEARSERDSTRALLAQRDAELEALRSFFRWVEDWVADEIGTDSLYSMAAKDVHNAMTRTLTALSDNQEGR